MDFSAAHSGFVIVSYVFTGISLVGLCIFVLGRDRKLAKKLKSLDNK
jgi:hypothetical protein